MKAPVTYIPSFDEHADGDFGALRTELNWEQRDAPRQEYYCNDFDVPYVYGRGAGQRLYTPSPWHPVIKAIRMKLEEYTATKFEVCFLNRYLNQSMHLGWHADDSPEMDDDRPIAIVSLGVPREIWFRPKYWPKPEDTESLLLKSGSLCLMAPRMQEDWQHRIPKASFQCGERISLTFRGYKAVE